MARLQQTTQGGYKLEIQRECEFDEEILANQPELKKHPLVHNSPLNIRDALYGGRTETMQLRYKIREVEAILNVDVTISFHMPVFQIQYRSPRNSCGRCVSGRNGYATERRSDTM
jgi:hypothetical protein